MKKIEELEQKVDEKEKKIEKLEVKVDENDKKIEELEQVKEKVNKDSENIKTSESTPEPKMTIRDGPLTPKSAPRRHNGRRCIDGTLDMRCRENFGMKKFFD